MPANPSLVPKSLKLFPSIDSSLRKGRIKRLIKQTNRGSHLIPSIPPLPEEPLSLELHYIWLPNFYNKIFADLKLIYGHSGVLFTSLLTLNLLFMIKIKVWFGKKF